VDALAHEHGLTPRERDVLLLLVGGHAPKNMGALLGIAYATVRFHISNLSKKFGGQTQREMLAELVSTNLGAA
jgi:LuxR family transcriptional regulator, quorum-sensing system regulator BjaR1